MKKIFLLLIAFTFVLNAEFIRDDENAIVIDTETKLQWQDNLVFLRTWHGAIELCEKFALGDYTDWRVPNVNELISIVDYTHKDPSLNPIFKTYKSSVYWTSTTLSKTDKENNAWAIRFDDGSTNYPDKDSNQYIRCVRGGL